MINKRAIARLLTPVLVGWLAVMPYREARAFIPWAVPLVISGLNSAGGVAVADIVAAGASALIGGTIVALGITPQIADAPTFRVPTTAAASAPAIVPPTAPDTIEPVLGYGVRYQDNGAVLGFTLAEATNLYCKGGYLRADGSNAGAVCGGNGYCTGWAASDGWACSPSVDELLHIDRIAMCSKGYAEVLDDYGYLTSCTLSDSRLAVADNKIDYRRSGTAFSQMGDIDTSGFPVAIQSSSGAQNNVFITSGKDADGHSQTITLQALSTGGSLLTIRTERTDAEGRTYVDHQIIQLSAVGGVPSVSNANVASQGSYVDPATGVYVIQAAASGTGTGSESPSITFPSDYARAGEAAAAAGTISSAINALRTGLTETATAPTDPAYSKDYTGFGNTFSGLLGWQLPAHASQCPTGSFSVFGATFTLDSHCVLMQSNEGTLRAAMIAAWTLLALFIVLRA